MLRLILIRHGQTDANKNHHLQGQSDGILNETGIQQANQLGKSLKNIQIDFIFSSDMVRAESTALAIAKHHNLSVETTSLIREWNCGEWDGKTADEFIKFVKNLTTPLSTFRPPGGETLVEVRERACEFVKKLEASYCGKTMLVCSHGDFLRMMISVMMNETIEAVDANYRMDNASYSIFILNGTKWEMLAFNQKGVFLED